MSFRISLLNFADCMLIVIFNMVFCSELYFLEASILIWGLIRFHLDFKKFFVVVSLALRCCVQTFSSWLWAGASFFCSVGGFPCCEAQALSTWATVAAAHCVMWDLSLQFWDSLVAVLRPSSWAWGLLALLLPLLSRFSRVRLCDPIDGSPPGFPVAGILQARTLEWDMSNLSSSTRDPAGVRCTARWILNHWTTRKVPRFFF